MYQTIAYVHSSHRNMSQSTMRRWPMVVVVDEASVCDHSAGC